MNLPNRMDELPDWLKITIELVGRTALCLLISYLGYKVAGMIGFLFTVPVWGGVFAGSILSFIAWCYKTTAQMPIRKYNGNYYEFANTQIRIFVVDNRLWCVDRDVLSVIRKKPNVMLESLYSSVEYDKIPGTIFRGFSEAGVQKLLAKSEHVEALRMLHWFRRDVQKLHHRKLELARGVAAPVEDKTVPIPETKNG